MKIKVTEDTIIQEVEKLKILGFHQNKRNTMDSQLTATASKVGLAMSKLRPALPYLTPETRKQLVNMKIKPIALYGIQLYLGQPQSIIYRAASQIQKVNRFMTTNPEGLKSISALCRYLDIDDPLQDIVKSSFTFIHKIIQTKRPEQIIDQLNIPRRSSAKIYFKGKPNSLRSRRTPINSCIDLYNAIPMDFKLLPHKKMKSKLKNLKINYSIYK